MDGWTQRSFVLKLCGIHTYRVSEFGFGFRGLSIWDGRKEGRNGWVAEFAMLGSTWAGPGPFCRGEPRCIYAAIPLSFSCMPTSPWCFVPRRRSRRPVLATAPVADRLLLEMGVSIPRTWR